MTQTVSDLFQKSKTEWLEEARATARKLLKQQFTVTIEDVLAVTPLPKYLHRNTCGGVFMTSDFRPVGYTHSKRQVSHGRVLRLWTANIATVSKEDVPRNWKRLFRTSNFLGAE